MESLQTVFTEENLGVIYNYEQYLQLLTNLVDNQQTTGVNQSEDLATYTRLNLVRMQRLDKTVVISDLLEKEIMKIDSPQTWYVILEGWCGDAAQSVPVIAKLASINQHIDLRLILRDDHPVIMDQYLTNGGRSIPKLIGLDVNGAELFTWGPRPAKAQVLYDAFKNNPEKGFVKFAEELQLWYAKDKTKSIQEEVLITLQGN